MHKLLTFLVALAAVVVAHSADAATKFWVGGTGTWSNSNTANWSLTSGGASGAAVPANNDSVTFDSNSGGGTVSVSATFSGIAFNIVTTATFTGTVDFSVGNPTITSNIFTWTGTGTKTVILGSSTFNCPAAAANVWDATTNTTITAGTSNIVLENIAAFTSAQTFAGGGQTYATVTVQGRTFGTQVTISGGGTMEHST